jgi:hypothetical protein
MPHPNPPHRLIKRLLKNTVKNFSMVLLKDTPMDLAFLYLKIQNIPTSLFPLETCKAR